MIRKLRTKFVCVIMGIVMLMLATILGVVIRFTGQNMEMQSINMMRAIATAPFQQGNLGKPPEEVRLPFFTVQIGSRGELLGVSGGYFDLTDREYIQNIVNAALASEEKTEELEEYQLRFLKEKTPMGYTIVFSDTTTESATLKNLYSICGLIFFVAMGVFLGISIFLSNWVIKPVATAWDQQRQFVADASHELKTPLSVIMANAELLEHADTADEDRSKFSRNILSMTYQMRALVENLLEMARVDNGTLNMPFAALDFSELVSDAVLSFQLLYEEKGQTLQSRIPEGLTLQGSQQHLYQVMDILLDNALKYSVPGGHTNAELKRIGHSCLLTVANTGEPISREDLTNIFKRFYRVDKARSLNGSYGLGLSIAQAIVEAHKGIIWAESDNGYNTFFVQLPSN